MKQDVEFETIHRKIEQLVRKVDVLQNRIQETETKILTMHKEQKRQRKLEAEMWTKNIL
jgi:predicted translin family RNA/ssDNA-binding protein